MMVELVIYHWFRDQFDIEMKIGDESDWNLLEYSHFHGGFGHICRCDTMRRE